MTWALWMLGVLFCRIAGSIAAQRETPWASRWLYLMFECEDRAAAIGFDWLSLVALLFLMVIAGAELHTLRTELDACLQ